MTNTCVLCSKVAITTAAQIPVCMKHWQEYEFEAEQYLPLIKREAYLRLITAYELRTGKFYFGGYSRKG